MGNECHHIYKQGLSHGNFEFVLYEVGLNKHTEKVVKMTAQINIEMQRKW